MTILEASLVLMYKIYVLIVFLILVDCCWHIELASAAAGREMRIQNKVSSTLHTDALRCLP